MPDTLPATKPDTIHHIPLAEIDDGALTRDRASLDEAALTELRLSIAANGLRLPIEVWRLARPRGPHRYGLISGLRRLRAFAALHALTGEARYAAIPAILRQPDTLARTLGAMVEENEIRAPLSPWERGRIAWLAREQGLFASIEEAVAGLYPAADRWKRARLRALAHLAEEFDGLLAAPETLTQRQCLRIAAAVQAGFGEVIRTALEESRAEDAPAQWQVLLPVLAEAERQPASAPPPRPGRPRRVSRPRTGLTIRREMTGAGWCLHFTGRDATSALLDAVFDEIERLFAPE